MTEPRRPDGPFEVPVHSLAGGRREGRRGIVVAVTLVALLGGAFGLARLSGDGPAAERSAVPDVAVASLSSSTLPSTSPRPTGSIFRGTLTDPRIERVLDVPDRALPGAPDVIFTLIDGRDVAFETWHPGGGLVATGSVRGVLAADEPIAIPIVAPTGTRQMIVSSFNTSAQPSGTTRIVNGLGRTIWTATDVAIQSGGLWSDDGSLAVLAGTGRSWHLVTIQNSGSARSRAVDQVVELPGDVFLPLPVPIGSITIPRVAPRTVPIGFSADGRWIYGGVVSPELGMLIGEFRVRIDGGRVERVATFGVGDPDGLLPRPGSVAARLVDPVTGRVATWRVNIDTTGGPPTLDVRNPDKASAFTVTVPAMLGSAWDGDGSLYVLWADAPLFADRVTLSRVAADGSLEPALLETGPVTSGTLIAVRDGYAALTLWTNEPESRSQIVLIDLADPDRITALTLPGDDGTDRGVIVDGDIEPRPPMAP